MEQEWWYADGDEKAGPLPLSDLLKRLADDRINLNTLVWQPGWKEWRKLINLEEIRSQVLETLREQRSRTPPPLSGAVHAAVLPEVSNSKSSSLSEAAQRTKGINESGKFLGGSHRSEELESAKKLFFILLGVDIAITVLVGLNAFSTIGTLKDIQSGNREVDESLLSSLKFWDGFSTLIILTMIGVGLGLVKWLNSCYRFAKDSLGATGFKNERWTAAGWIIPIFNLFKPYQIVNEIYKAGAPTYTASDDWKKENSSGLLLTWWIFWAVTHFVGTIISRQLFRGAMRDDVTLPQAIGATELQAWAYVISIIIAGLWFVVASTLTQRLLARSVLPAAKGASEQFVSPISPAIPAMTTTQQTAAGACEPAAIQAPKNVVTTTEDDYYEQALGEIETGQTAKAMWARAIADAEGNDAKTKALYIRYRVEKLKASAAEEQARIEAEKLREQRRREAEQREDDARRREAMKTEEERRNERERLETLAKKVTSDGWVSDAIELIQMIGGKCETNNRPTFSGIFVTEKSVVTLDGQTYEFEQAYDLAQWVRSNVAPRVLERVAREQAAQTERL
ncbi:MAG: DUF4328 domain-containing protein [Betaproteobacteria bacterium]|nr:DUF4328 domain-containing protein [Betaproteobacteria bacterium]